MFFKAAGKNAFLRSVSARIDRCTDPVFGIWDAVELLALVAGILLVMRCLVC